MQKERHIAMSATKERITKEQKKLEKSCKETKSDSNDIIKDLEDCTLHLLRKKAQKISVRAYFAEQCYYYIKEAATKENINLEEHDPDIFIYQIPLLIEGVMTVLYHDNQIWDRKNNLDAHQEQISVGIGGRLLRTRLHEYILEYFPQDSKCDIMFHYMEKALNYVNIGQYLDKFCNNYTYFKQHYSNASLHSSIPFLDKEVDQLTQLSAYRNLIEANKKELPQQTYYLETYFRRLYLISSVLFRFTVELIMDLLNYQGQERQNLINYAEGYGIMMQVVNDTADFVKDMPTLAKSSNDVQSDLRNKTITLPLIYHLNHHHSDGLIEKYLKTSNPTFLNQKHNTILQEIIQSGALIQSIAIGKQWAKQTATFLNNQLITAQSLASMLDIAYINRYYWHIRQAKKSYKQNKSYKCEDNYSKQKRKAQVFTILQGFDSQ